jgi:hypothetical protein
MELAAERGITRHCVPRPFGAALQVLALQTAHNF